MIKTLELFIGADNKTGKVNRLAIEQTMSKYHEGFTIQPAIGYWMGKREESVTVIVSDEVSTIIDTIKRLKQVLKQDAIAYHEVAELEFI